MSRMSELDLEIRERTARGDTPDQIAFCLDIPLHWVQEWIGENAYNDHFFAEQSADADAEMYGTR